MKRRVYCVILMVCMLLCLSIAQADPKLDSQDASVRTGSWEDVYSAILRERADDIRAYQEYVLGITSLPSCKPVDLLDLTGDGIPELLFLDLVNDTEYGFQVGRLWIYTSDGSGVHCALTLQPEIDDMLYSRVYLAKNGLLTIHFNDTEMYWIMRFRPDIKANYTAETTLIEQADFSGEGPDSYFRDGKKISREKYRSLTAQIQADEGVLIGSFMVDDGGSGFTYTLDEALDALSIGKIRETLENAENGSLSGELPELSFSKGSFTGGQKFEVYSAPSNRSWRGANGKAAITSGSEIFVGGMADGWILILYELDNGVIRVGYINSDKIKGQYTSGEALSFPKIQRTLIESTEMTDDPIRQKTTIGKLKKGTVVTCLARFRGWIYVEAKVSGKTARGFIASDSLARE